MTALELLDDLRGRDVILTARGDKLVFDAPHGVMTSGVRASLASRKRELLAALAGDWEAAAAALLDQVQDDDLRADLRFEFEERAAIAEYDSQLPRTQAERIGYVHIAAELEDTR